MCGRFINDELGEFVVNSGVVMEEYAEKNNNNDDNESGGPDRHLKMLEKGIKNEIHKTSSSDVQA